MATATRHTAPKHRKPTIKQALAALTREGERWESGNDAEPSERWWNAVDDALTAISENPHGLPDDLLCLCDPAAEAINGYLDGIGRKDEETGDPITAPHKRLLSGVSRLLAAKPHEWPPLESIKDLMGLPGMTIAQVAQMHGLPVPQVTRIIAGEEKYPANHVTPHVIDQQKTRKSLRHKLILAAAKWNAHQSVKESERQLTATEMLANGMTTGEVADEFGVDEDAVIDEALDSGLDAADDDAGQDGDAGGGEVDTDLEEQIVMLSDDGMSNAQIAESLDLPVQRVASVVRFAQKMRAKVSLPLKPGMNAHVNGQSPKAEKPPALASKPAKPGKSPATVRKARKNAAKTAKR